MLAPPTHQSAPWPNPPPPRATRRRDPEGAAGEARRAVPLAGGRAGPRRARAAHVRARRAGGSAAPLADLLLARSPGRALAFLTARLPSFSPRLRRRGSSQGHRGLRKHCRGGWATACADGDERVGDNLCPRGCATRLAPGAPVQRAAAFGCCTASVACAIRAVGGRCCYTRRRRRELRGGGLRPSSSSSTPAAMNGANAAGGARRHEGGRQAAAERAAEPLYVGAKGGVAKTDGGDLVVLLPAQ